MGQLAEAYRRHFGGTQSSTQLYGGFAAFFAGAAFGLLGILLVVSGGLLIQEPMARYKAGILIASLGMPFLFMGLQLTLPSRLVIHALAGLGALVCFAGVVLFLVNYPGSWGPRADVDNSGQVIGVYTVGLVLLVTTTAMALVVNFISRHMVLPGQELEGDLFADPDRPVTMDEVMRDIEREVAKQKLTWGGMEEERLPREFLKLKADFGAGATVSQGRAGKITETLANEMDAAFTSLARLRGIEGKEVSGEDDTSTAIDALKALRRARQVEMESSWWYRFKRWLVGLFTGKAAGPEEDPEPQRTSPNVEVHDDSRSAIRRPADDEAVIPGPDETERPGSTRARELKARR